MNKCKCNDFEKDESVYLEGDKPCCSVCKWNNATTESCMIGRDEND